MKMLFVVLQVEIDNRQVILITSSYKKAQKLADKLQEHNNPNYLTDDSNGIIYEIEYYKGFSKIENYYFDNGVEEK